MTDLTGACCVLWVAACAGRAQESESALVGRLLVCAGLCLCAAALSCGLPAFFPGVHWM